jgi:hypothetical protein
VGSVGEAVKKTKVFAFQRVLKRNKKEKHKQNRLPVVVEKKISYEKINSGYR